MPDKKLTDVTDNNVGKMSDSDIVRILEEMIEYNNRIGRPTAIMDIYSLELFLELIKRQKEQLQANSDSRQTNECENIDVVRFEAEIDRQKAEIERLKTNLNVELDNFASEYDDKIKAEAYKECVEKVKEKSKKSEVVCSGALVTTSYLISAKNLNNLLKELVGDK